MNKLYSLLTGTLIASLLMLAVPVQADIIGTEDMLAQQNRADLLATVEDFIVDEQVAAQLEAWGVPADMVAARIAAMSDTELQQLANRMQEAPAGGNVLPVLGAVFAILLVLELLGITNIIGR